MKFAIGFVVGTFVGRPVLASASRRINLTQKVQNKIAAKIYDIADRIAVDMNRRVMQADQRGREER